MAVWLMFLQQEQKPKFPSNIKGCGCPSKEMEGGRGVERLRKMQMRA